MEPIRVHPQIVYKGGKPVSVILSIEEFEALLDAAEELEDIAAVHEALKEPMDLVAFDDYLREVQAKRDAERGNTDVSGADSSKGETAA